MRMGMRITAFAMIAVLCLGNAGMAADTPARRHKKVATKADPPPPLRSGTTVPLRQIPLDSMPAVAPEVTYEDGHLTIVALNSTLADILRAVRKETGADMEIPPNATDRVVTHLGPGPAREVMAELLNGSHFNYVLLGSPRDANQLTRVVLVANSAAESPATSAAARVPGIGNVIPNPAPTVADDATSEAEDTADDPPEPTIAAEPEQPTPPAPGQPGVKTPQQLLQEMQQRQLQLQQQGSPGQPPVPVVAPAPNMPGRPQSEQQ